MEASEESADCGPYIWSNLLFSIMASSVVAIARDGRSCLFSSKAEYFQSLNWGS